MTNDIWKIMENLFFCLLPPAPAACLFFRLSFAEESRISYTSVLPNAFGSHFPLVALPGARLAVFFEGGVYVRPC